MKKCGYVSIVGKPNVGKSTLMNIMLNFNLSIVNKKAQTTRNKILGILTENNYQIIFIDTPGILEPKYQLQKFMLEDLKSSFKDADVILYLIDVEKFTEQEINDFLKKFRKHILNLKIIYVINKIDLVNQEIVNNVIELLKYKFEADEVIPISAKIGFNVNSLKDAIVKHLPESEFYFDEKSITDRPEKFFVSEIIREKALDLYKDEIPYSVFVNIREFKEREKGKDYINAEIVLERESQKGIILGKGGNSIKKLGQLARVEIEKFLGREVYLELFVKVKKDWKKDVDFLRANFGK